MPRPMPSSAERTNRSRRNRKFTYPAAMGEELVAVTAIGRDRSGIVAGVTKVLFEQGCNLQDVSSTILGGHFSMMLVVRIPQGLSAEGLEAKLADAAGSLGLLCSVKPVADEEREVTPPTHMVSVYGADRPGIVYKVADILTRKHANITDLTSRVIGSAEEPVYALMLEVAVPEGVDVTPELDDLRSELGVDVSVHAIGADVL